MACVVLRVLIELLLLTGLRISQEGMYFYRLPFVYTNHNMLESDEYTYVGMGLDCAGLKIGMNSSSIFYTHLLQCYCML